MGNDYTYIPGISYRKRRQWIPGIRGGTFFSKKSKKKKIDFFCLFYTFRKWSLTTSEEFLMAGSRSWHLWRTQFWKNVQPSKGIFHNPLGFMAKLFRLFLHPIFFFFWDFCAKPDLPNWQKCLVSRVYFRKMKFNK